MSTFLWSGILIASVIQCIFLLFLLFSDSNIQNKNSRNLLCTILLVTLLISVSNLITSSYLYREIPQFAGFARGMVLLLGPLLYLYLKSIIDKNFRLQWKDVLHLLPYVVALILIRIQLYGVSNELYISAVDYLMKGKIPMTIASSFWFIAYFLHLTFYLLLTRSVLNKSIKSSQQDFRISIEDRQKWVTKLSVIFGILSLLFLGISSHSYISGVYSAVGNFIYTTILAVMVYLITYQALISKGSLTPNFLQKYGGNAMSQDTLAIFRTRFKELFEIKKVFLQPDLRVAQFAEMMQLQPHIVSSFINSEFNKSFTELLHENRIDEFIKRVEKEDFRTLSIMGIAYEVGYSSKSAFNTSFKKQTGKTPSQFIKERNK